MWESDLHIYPLRVKHYDDEMESNAELTKTYRPELYHNGFSDGTFVMGYGNDDPACVWYGMTIVENIEKETYTRAMYNHCSNELAYQVWMDSWDGAKKSEHEVIDGEMYTIPTEIEPLIDLLEDVLENGIGVVEGNDNVSIDESEEDIIGDDEDSSSTGLSLQTASDVR